MLYMLPSEVTLKYFCVRILARLLRMNGKNAEIAKMLMTKFLV